MSGTTAAQKGDSQPAKADKKDPTAAKRPDPPLLDEAERIGALGTEIDPADLEPKED